MRKIEKMRRIGKMRRIEKDMKEEKDRKGEKVMAEMREVFLRKFGKGVGILGLCGLLLFTGCSKQDALPGAGGGENPGTGASVGTAGEDSGSSTGTAGEDSENGTGTAEGSGSSTGTVEDSGSSTGTAGEDSGTGMENGAGDGQAASSGQLPVSGLELQKLTELTEDFSNQVRAVKETEYQNLIFGEDFLVTAPEAEKVYDLELTRKPALPAEELLQKFDALVDFQWEDVYSDEEKEELYRYWPLGGVGRNDSLKYPYNYPSFLENFEKLKNGEAKLTMLIMDTEQGSLALDGSGYVQFLNGNKTARRYDAPVEGALAGPYMPKGYFADYRDTSSTDSYPLLGGEVRICDAVREAEELIGQGIYGDFGDFQPKVVRVRPVELEEGEDGYRLEFSCAYKGLNLAVANLGEYGGGFSVSSMSDDRKMDLTPGVAFMLEKGKLDVLVGCWSFEYDVKEREEYDSVLSFAEGVRLMSEAFSPTMRLTVREAQLCYARFQVNEESDDAEEEYAEASWEFVAENENDGRVYHIFINALNGYCFYYTE